MKKTFLIIALLTALLSLSVQAQRNFPLFSAESYIQLKSSPLYSEIVQKKDNGNSLTPHEIDYLKIYEKYLSDYFNKMNLSEQSRYLQIQNQKFPIIDEETTVSLPSKANDDEFEWLLRDRLLSAGFGAFYGATPVVLFDMEFPTAVALPLISAGISVLSPNIFQKKYEDITREQLAMRDYGRFFGLGQGIGLSLGLFDARNNSEALGNSIMLMGSVGSFLSGELAWGYQKKNKLTAGQIEMLKHYSFLGYGMGLNTGLSQNDERIAGVVGFAAGASGLLIGNKVGKLYDYTKGDVVKVHNDALSYYGMGMALAVGISENRTYEYYDYRSDNKLRRPEFYFPIATSILGTIISQKQVKNARLTTRQGSMITLSNLGGATLGLGLVVLVEPTKPAPYILIPSIVGWGTSQLVYLKFKNDNISRRKNEETSALKVEFNLRPENVFINKNMAKNARTMEAKIGEPVATLKFRF